MYTIVYTYCYCLFSAENLRHHVDHLYGRHVRYTWKIPISRISQDPPGKICLRSLIVLFAMGVMTTGKLYKHFYTLLIPQKKSAIFFI